jgi:predicted Ser/Thr protein kinase
VSDPFEQTATAPAGSGPTEGLQPGAVFDHFVIQRPLGSGGMGVVYEALDVDLQRKVALKVLREGLAHEAQRLLREARAMAKLAHPHVVTVYEVSTFKGRDFVVMELFDGESIAEWLREAPRTQEDIVAAFVAAGRGLAAAHAAGIVHRDFKPHNVLRSKSGRIAVTDFGLARDTADALATTQPVTASGTATAVSSSDVTVPGSVLGTPAYMAPEQWSGGRLTAATDQFAFCVALWEALAGERPYRGTTLEQLREQVSRGPEKLDDDKLPRRLRTVLRRGLAPDPAARWPSMDALLAELAPRARRLAPVVAGTAALIAGAAVLLIVRATGDGDRGPSCPPPAIAPPTGAKLDAWNAQRALACAAPPAVRDGQLACLDRVLARIDAIERVRVLAPKANLDELAVDPALCMRAEPPPLPARYSDDAVAALALLAGATVGPDRVQRARDVAAAEPCVGAYLALADARLDDARPLLRVCGDATASAELVLRALASDAITLDDAELAQRVREAEALLEIAGRRERRWQVDAARAEAFDHRDRHGDAIAAYDAAIAGAPESERPRLVARKLAALLERGLPADHELARKEAATWRPVAERLGARELADRLAWIDATAQWSQGDVAGANPRLRELHAKYPGIIPGGTRLTGTVVDARGAPVANATVAAGYAIFGDSSSIVAPLWTSFDAMRTFEVATTDANGKFEIERGPRCWGVMTAQHGSDRARPIAAREGARLVLQPTTSVRGRVELGGRVGSFTVSVSQRIDNVLGGVGITAPVAADGSFEVRGIIAGETTIGVGEGTLTLANHASMRPLRVAPGRPIDNLVLELPAGREVRVLIRGSATFVGAPVFVIDGNFAGKVLTDLFALESRQIATSQARAVLGRPAPEIASHYRPGDLLAAFASAPTGRATVCVMPRIRDCIDVVPITCKPVPANAAVVVLGE